MGWSTSLANDDTPPHGMQQFMAPQAPSDGFMMLVAERLARIEVALEGIRRDRDEMQKERDDHETRIRGLERWRYMLPSSLFAAVISAGVTVYGLLRK